MHEASTWILQYALMDYKAMPKVNSVVFVAHGRHLIKLCVDGLVVPQDPAQSKQ